VLTDDNARGFHEWAARYGWDGTGVPLEPPNCLWNSSTRAELMAAYEMHRTFEADCYVCARAKRDRGQTD